MQEIKIPVVSGVDVLTYERYNVIDKLVKQISSPIRWNDVIKKLLKYKDMRFEEVSKGNSAFKKS